MTSGLTVLLALTFVTFFNLGLGHYTHFVTYSLFPNIARVTDPDGFRQYHQAYQSRLPLIAFGPFALIVALSLTFLFVHPEESGLLLRVLVLLFNLTVAVVSAVFAGPTHRRIFDVGEVSEKDGKALLRWNAVRVGALVANAIILVYLLVQAIS